TQQLEKDAQVAQVVGPVDRLPEQILLLRQRDAALERVADVAIALVAKDANARVVARETLCDPPSVVGGPVVDEHDLIIDHDGLQEVDGALEEIGDAFLLVVAVADQAYGIGEAGIRRGGNSFDPKFIRSRGGYRHRGASTESRSAPSRGSRSTRQVSSCVSQHGHRPA